MGHRCARSGRTTPCPSRCRSGISPGADRLAARDALRVFQLRIAGRIVASRIAFVVGDSVYLYYLGFDPAWARYSAMTTTVAEVFKYAIAGGIKTVNLSLTPEQSKLRWRRRLVQFRAALVHREHVSARIACHAYRVAAGATGVPAQVLKDLLRGRRICRKPTPVSCRGKARPIMLS